MADQPRIKIGSQAREAKSLTRAHDQQLAGAIIFMLTASIVTLNFVTDILLAFIDPRVWRSITGRS